MDLLSTPLLKLNYGHISEVVYSDFYAQVCAKIGISLKLQYKTTYIVLRLHKWTLEHIVGSDIWLAK